jgi:hypothetical protein
LNLLRPGSSPAINYYGLVRPEQEFRFSYQSLQQQSLAFQQNLANVETNATQLITGNRGQFLNYSRYFMNNAQPPSVSPRGSQPTNLVSPRMGGSRSGSASSGASRAGS